MDQGNSLTLESFGGLFLIAGIASAFALSIHLLIFLYKHKHILFASEKPVWERLISIGRHFDKKDHSCCDLRTETNGRSLTGDGGIVVPSHISSSPRISNDTIGSITQEDGRIGISSNKYGDTIGSITQEDEGNVISPLAVKVLEASGDV